MNPIELQLALTAIPEEQYADLPTQVARGLISGGTLGFYRPWEAAGRGGLPETVASIAAGIIPYGGLARLTGLGVAGLGRLAPKLLAEGVPAAQALRGVATMKPLHTMLSSRGRLATAGGAMAGLSALPELWSEQPKTMQERLTGAALSAGLGMATEGLAQRFFRGGAPSRTPTGALGDYPTATKQPMEWLGRPIREEYEASLARLQARRADVVSAAQQATEGILDKKRFREIQKGFRKQIRDIEEMGLPLGQDVIEGIQRPGWVVPPPLIESTYQPGAAARRLVGLTDQDLRRFLHQRGITVGEDVPRERLIEMLTQRAIPAQTGGMPIRRVPGINVAVPTVAEGVKTVLRGVAPTPSGGILPYTKLTPPPELTRKFGVGIGVTEIDPQTKMIVNPESWTRKMRNILKSDPTGVDPDLLGPGMYMIRNAKGRVLPRDLRLAADIANDSMYPSLADVICR